MKTWKRLLALAMCLVVCLGALPGTAGAEETDHVVKSIDDAYGVSLGDNAIMNGSVSSSFLNGCSAAYKSGPYYANLAALTLTNDSKANLINVANSQVGYHEGNSADDFAGTSSGSDNYTEYNRWYFNNSTNHQAWCNLFVSWCFAAAGISTDVAPKNPFYLDQWRSKGARVFSWKDYTDGLFVPSAGDVIVFGGSTTNNKSGDSLSMSTTHIGILTNYSNGTFYTVEGNTGDQVKTKSYTPNSSTGNVSSGRFVHAIIQYGNSTPPSTQWLNINVETPPSGNLTYGKGYSLKGSITCSEPLLNIYAYIGTAKGQPVSGHEYAKTYTTSQNVTSYNIKTDGMDSAIKFGDLPVGSYVFQIIAYSECNHTESPVYHFNIVNQSSNPSAPSTPTVSVSGSTVTVTWADVANETSYDVYLIQEPWSWEAVKYSQSVSANVCSATFYEVSDGYYCAFVISRPNADTVQSSWAEFTVSTMYYLDVNGWINGAQTAGIDRYGIFDLYINGVLDGSGLTDKCAQWPYGSTYEIRNIRPLNGYSFDGILAGAYADTLSYPGKGRTGTITENLSVNLMFHACPSSINESPVSVVYNGHTYYYFSTLVTWYDARAICENMGGHLATITDADENAFVYSLANGNMAWLGASDIDQEGQWKWINGETFSFSDWAENQPDNYAWNDAGQENYLQFSGSGDGTWNDCAGYSVYPFICEVDSAQYTITYDANGGTGAPEPQIKQHDVPLTLSDVVPTREGWTFLGWAPLPDATEPTGWPGGTTDVNQDFTFYAVWQKNETPPVTGDTIRVGSASGAPGATVRLPVTLDSNPGLAYLRFTVNYDKTRLELTGYEDGALTGWTGNLSGGGFGWDDTQNSTAAGTVLTLIFTIKSNAPEGSAAVSLTGVEAYDFNESAVALTPTAGAVTVSSRIPGDATGDGQVNGQDLIRLRKYLIGMNVDIDLSAANVNGDDGVDGRDLIRLRKHLIGMDVKLMELEEPAELLGAGVLRLAVPSAPVHAGDTVSVPVSLSGADGFAYLSFRVDYDKTRLKLLGFEDGALTGWTADLEGGGFGWDDVKDAAPEGTILTLRFQVLADTPTGKANVTLQQIEAFNFDEATVTLTSEAAALTVAAPANAAITSLTRSGSNASLTLKLSGIDAAQVQVLLSAIDGSGRCLGVRSATLTAAAEAGAYTASVPLPPGDAAYYRAFVLSNTGSVPLGESKDLSA